MAMLILTTSGITEGLIHIPKKGGDMAITKPDTNKPWKAVIVDVSAVDASGNVEVVYQLLDPSDVVLYDNLRVYGPATEIESMIVQDCTELKVSNADAEKIAVGKEIVI